MKIDRKEAEDLLRYCGYPNKDCSDEQLMEGLSKLGDGEYDETTEAGSAEQTELLQSVLYALKQGKPLELTSKEENDVSMAVANETKEEENEDEPRDEPSIVPDNEEKEASDETTDPSSIENEENEMKPKKRGRGRPPKDPNAAPKTQKTPHKRGRGRPKKEIKPLPRKIKEKSTKKLVKRQRISHNTKKKAGIVSTIIEVLQKGSSTTPISKEQVHAVLVKKFPHRDKDAMWNTVQSQIPTCLEWHKGIKVHAVKEKGERTRYWLPKNLSSVTGRPAKHK